jgi:hypothetical protein
VNVFATSPDPVASAKALDDKRINKMIVESCQILSTVLHATGRGSPALYRAAYARHPVVLWTAADARNYTWVFRHLEALFSERAYRTGKTDHASLRLLPLLRPFAKSKSKPKNFENCTPHKRTADVHHAYRKTMVAKWRKDIRPPTWARRGPPDFFRPKRASHVH